MRKIIAQGAEALLIRHNNLLVKKRVKKGYRQHELDVKLREGRTRRESRILEKVSGIINVPSVKKVSHAEIEMDFIKGKLLSEFLDTLKLGKALEICKQLGKEVAALHNSNIIHGDLTTSNMILSKNKVYFIDFGLGFHSNKIEDKAVDLHLLRQAFQARHFKRFQSYYNAMLSAYKKNTQQAKEILARLAKVEQRGRYKRKGKGKIKVVGIRKRL